MGAGNVRNEPCWCGSGKKYKHCHLGREDDERVSVWDGASVHSSAFSAKECLAARTFPGQCQGAIVRAHTVPRSGSLSKIARDGQVYVYKSSMNRIIHSNGELSPVLQGVGKASTFNGFCQHHDREIFLPLEVEEFESRPDQCMLLAYRAYAIESYNKRAMLKTVDFMKTVDKGRSTKEQFFIRMTAGQLEIGVRAAINDLLAKQPTFDRALQSGDPGAVRAYVIRFDGVQPVMACAGFNPMFDFSGAPLQNLGDLSVTASLITVTSFCSGDSGYLVLAWLQEDDAVCSAFVESLCAIPDSELTDAVVSMLFEHCENVQISPEWWDGLTDGERSGLSQQMRESADPHEALSEHGFTVRVSGLPSWKPVARYKVEGANPDV